MSKERERSEPRYMEITEEVVYGVGGYFSLRLSTVDEKLASLYDLREKKNRATKNLPKNRIARALKRLTYGDWLTDYESEQIDEQKRIKQKLTEIMSEVVESGRVDSALTELRQTIAGCIGYLKSDLRATDSAGQKIAQAKIWMAEEAIEALKVIEPEEAEGYSKQLEKITEDQWLWESGI